MGNNSPFTVGPHLMTSKFVFTTLLKGHHMIIFANLQSNLSISFWGEDFQRRVIYLIIGHNGPTLVGASFIDGASLF